MIMEFSLLSISGLIVCAAFFFTGLVDAICGGGGLISFPALMITGIPVHYIAGTNQAATLIGSVTSTVKYARSGNVDFKTAIFTVPFAMIGSSLGSRLNMIVPDRYLIVLMLALVPALAILMLVKGHDNEDRSDSVLPIPKYITCALIGLIIGCYQGFYGPGTGMFLTMAFTMLLKFNILKASGNSRFISTAACISASLTYAFSGLVVWKITIAATLFNIAGNYLGAVLAVKKGARIIRPILYIVLTLLMIRVLSDIL